MSSSYANVTGNPSRIKVNFNTLFTPAGNGIDVVVPVKSNRVISERFANTAYGFFFRNPVAYHVVANYVKNTLGKYGLVRSMFSSSTRLFSFQFSSMDRLDAMLKNGPWFIRKSQLIMKKWHLDVNLLKEDVGIVLVWVKLHGVPVTVFTEDDFSAIATKFCTPLMLDSYTVEKLIIDEKVTLSVDEGKPLKKVVFSGDYDSDDEVASIDNEMASFFAKKDGNGTQSFLEQWKESYENNEYEYDPYDDNMYEGQEILDKIQAIYDNFDFKVRGHKKK
uniref:DUF4283 domain-containing protein n=1 Tax=Tanacetum cinerariifolium TaxID=118510 RepID=A0A6L2M4G1_TANCI|nr:hypothetical protein [Tanacetum cinerariifolium]